MKRTKAVEPRWESSLRSTAGPSLPDLESAFLQAYPQARRAARAMAGNLVSCLGLPQVEREDIEQEVMLDLWLRLQRFESRLSSLPTFATRVARNRVTMIFRSYTAAKRNARQIGRASCRERV